MFEQDYVMRLIKEMVRAVLKLLFDIDTASPSSEMLENREEKETLDRLLNMVDKGRINEAENRIAALICDGDSNRDSSLKIALLFYSYLNDKPDTFLNMHNFSRDEIKLGIQYVADRYGINDITKIFLE